MSNVDTLQTIAYTINTFRGEDDVVEVRILNTNQRTVNGYFNDPVALAHAVEPYIGKHDIYFTLNPVKRDLLARSENRLQGWAKHTTTDKDIDRIEFILVDLDPVRPSGISATNEEHNFADEMCKKILKFLIKQGFPEPTICDSGNGYHIVMFVDLENTEQNVKLVKDFLAALDLLFSNESVQVDTTTYNPGRIVKLYGTLACKGDDTQKRPHRWSKIISEPEKLYPVPVEKFEQVVSYLPEPSQSEKTSRIADFDIETWLEEKGLKVAFSAPFHGKGTKYVLEVCPWNPDHTNHSACVIKFNNGGIAAQCLHNSCQGHNWESLRDLVEPDWRKNKGKTSGEGNKEAQADVIVRLAEDATYLTNELEEPFVAVEIDKHTEVLPLRGHKFKLYLTKLYYEATKKVPSSDAMNQALNLMEMKAMLEGEKCALHRRVAKYEGDFYYDLVDKNWQTVKITKGGCSLEAHPPILFNRSKNMKKQVCPDLKTDPKVLINLVKKHFRFKNVEDLNLFTAYLVTCFIAEIAHVILVLFGEKGAAKSTTMRMIKRIIDPAIQDLLTMPSSKQDLAIVVSNTYMPSFDNLQSISTEKSDLLCMAATGGAFAKRTLYTDADETILTFKRCICLNGINVVATRPDLLDRSIVLELDRVPKNERKTEAEVWQAFESDLPKMLGASLNAVSQAMAIHEQVVLKETGRMADFTYWGYAIAEVLGIGGNEFLAAYLKNQDRANEEAVASHPVAAAVVALMRDRNNWQSSVSELLKRLEKIAEVEKIDTYVKTWPKDSYVLSKRLKEVKSNLEETGIYFDIRHAGQYKKVTIDKKVDDKRS